VRFRWILVVTLGILAVDGIAAVYIKNSDVTAVGLYRCSIGGVPDRTERDVPSHQEGARLDYRRTPSYLPSTSEAPAVSVAAAEIA
jgi:hypothetical protein